MTQHIPRILMVCMGNICRSPTAEAVLRKMAQERGIAIHIDSAGTHAYHVGEAPDRRSRKAGEARGYDFSVLRARAVCSEDFERFDLILAADQANLAELRRRAPASYQHKLSLLMAFAGEPQGEVPDPYYGGESGFDTVLDLVECACRGLLDYLEQHQGATFVVRDA